jgi:indole-3-glycerol phosphate synthase
VSILDTIVAQKRREVAALPVERVTAAALRAAFERRGHRRDFVGALRQSRRGEVALIAEVKQASPSAGVIRPDFDPVGIARAYERAGATCLSVLTDERFFQGSLAFLKAIREAVSLPLLRKDFIIDERQIREAVEWGADAILLVVAILDEAALRRLHDLACQAGLGVLVEVHDEVELDRALAVQPALIGVNNRDLKTFQVNLATSERLAERLRGHAAGSAALLVAESGIHSRADVIRLKACGAGAILVGESLMRHADIEAKVRELMG